MSITLNNIWNQFNDLILSAGSPNSNLALKIRAVNFGNLYLAQRLLDRNIKPGDLLSSMTDIAVTANSKTASLPSDFMALHTLFYLDGSNYYPFRDAARVDLSDIIQGIGSDYQNTSNTGIPERFALDGDTITFDKHYSASDADGLRMLYYAIPATIIGYDQWELSGVSGTFQADETVSDDSNSNITTTIYSVVDSDTLYVNIPTNAFASGASITGATSGATATISSISTKPETFEWSSRYKLLLPHVYALGYAVLEGSKQKIELDEEIDGLIDLYLSGFKAPKLRLGMV